jgi:hypothetical protein
MCAGPFERGDARRGQELTQRKSARCTELDLPDTSRAWWWRATCQRPLTAPPPPPRPNRRHRKRI